MCSVEYCFLGIPEMDWMRREEEEQSSGTSEDLLGFSRAEANGPDIGLVSVNFLAERTGAEYQPSFWHIIIPRTGQGQENGEDHGTFEGLWVPFGAEARRPDTVSESKLLGLRVDEARR